MDSADLAAMIDHTLLAPTATAGEVESLVEEAAELGAASACVSPIWVPTAVLAAGGAVPIAAVVGFPSGAHTPVVKATEAAAAVEDGAAELDMVVALGHVHGGSWSRVGDDIAAVRRAIPDRTVLKVIVESATLTDDQLRRVCVVAVDAGADFVKTSTGFHPSGGATEHAVAVMRETVGPEIGVKASGGIRDRTTAVAMIEAGATRIGASATAAIVAG